MVAGGLLRGIKGPPNLFPYRLIVEFKRWRCPNRQILSHWVRHCCTVLLQLTEPGYVLYSHMGVTVTDASRGDIDRIVKALTESVMEARVQKA